MGEKKLGSYRKRCLEEEKKLECGGKLSMDEETQRDNER